MCTHTRLWRTVPPPALNNQLSSVRSKWSSLTRSDGTAASKVWTLMTVHKLWWRHWALVTVKEGKSALLSVMRVTNSVWCCCCGWCTAGWPKKCKIQSKQTGYAFHLHWAPTSSDAPSHWLLLKWCCFWCWCAHRFCLTSVTFLSHCHWSEVCSAQIDWSTTCTHLLLNIIIWPFYFLLIHFLTANFNRKKRSSNLDTIRNVLTHK